MVSARAAARHDALGPPALEEAGQLAAPLTRALSSTVHGTRHHRRRWLGERLHVEVRGLAPEPACDPALARRVAGAAEQEAGAVPGVRWAVANAPTGRLIVDIESPAVVPDVLAAVERAEEACGTATVGFPATAHAADREPIWQALTALAMDTAGLAVGTAGMAARARGLPHEVTVVTSVLGGEPHVRSLAAHLLGPGVGDVVLAAVNAVANGLAYGPVGVTADLAWRALYVTDAVSRRRRWAAFEPELCAHPRGAAARPVEARARPVAVPPGPIERYTDRATAAGVVAAASAVALTRNPARAAAAMYAALPTAARLGREAFAAQFGRVLSGHGAIVLDDTALRRLDRVDTVVVDVREGRGTRPRRWAEAVAGAARRAGLMVVEAARPGAPSRLGADLRVAGGAALADEVRSLQADGCVVLLVAGADAECADALWAADVGVGVWRGTGAVPWAADVLVPPAEAWRVVDAVEAAVAVARQSVTVCLAGAATAGAVTFGTARPQRASWAVNGAALLAMTNAARTAVGLARHEPPRVAAAAPPWHAMTGREVLESVGSRSGGLSGDEALGRVPAEERPTPAPLRMLTAVRDELVNPLTPLLLGGAGLSAALGGALDAAVVAGVTAANALLGGAQRWRTEQAAHALARVGDYQVHVRRDGTAKRVHPSEVVVGDVLVLRAGDVVPADARLLQADALLVDESTLTGESLPVEKSAEPTDAPVLAERHSMLYAGTSVLAGEAAAVVVATGLATEAGAAAVGAHPPTGGVDARLADLTRKAIPVSLGAGAAVIGVAALRGGQMREALRSGATLAVAAVPEGLPLVATMAQLASARRLAARGALVRNPRAIEALGRVDVLLTDKTGTLTVGRLEVKAVSDLETDADVPDLSTSHERVLGAAIRATPQPAEGMGMAHPTDAAIVRGGEATQVGEHTGQAGWRRVDELPFEP
ncbi:MAG TPA: HAD-IC family P-type ATPase, partial [Acidimicrobiales bacterium]|nr:HAD-IC family P-type ATPase [Acidimicrobiales bacterium]